MVRLFNKGLFVATLAAFAVLGNDMLPLVTPTFNNIIVVGNQVVASAKAAANTAPIPVPVKTVKDQAK